MGIIAFLPQCDRCANTYEVRKIFNIRPFNPNGKIITRTFVDESGNTYQKDIIEQQPILLCKNCRNRIYDWINGNTRKLTIAPDRMFNTKIDDLLSFNMEKDE